MATVVVPAVLRPLADGATSVEAAGATVREIIADLVRQHERLKDRIIDANGIRPEVFIAVDGQEVQDPEAPVAPGAQVHILPAIAGGELSA
jgi:molybdopterin converting factor small subunit